MGEALPGHPGQWKRVQPRLGGGGTPAARPEHGWAAPFMTEASETFDLGSAWKNRSGPKPPHTVGDVSPSAG